MLEFMERHCLENGFDGIVLHAMDTSKSSVERFGMKPLLTLEERRYFQQDVQAGDWCEGSFALFQELRNRYLAGCTGCVYWEEQELRFVYEDLRRDKKISR